MHSWAPYWLFTMVYACVPHFNLWRGHKHPCSFQLRIALNLKSTSHYMGIDLVPYVKSRTSAQHRTLQNIRGIFCRLLIMSLYCAKYWWSVYKLIAISYQLYCFKNVRIPKQHAVREILCSRIKLPTWRFFSGTNSDPQPASRPASGPFG